MVREYDGFSSVCYDDAGAVNLLMDRLHQQGHRHIGYLGVQLSDATTGQRRYQAYLDACERLKLTPRATLGELSYQSGFQHAAEVIDSHTSALICASDSIALGRSNTFSNSRRTPFRCAPSATPRCSASCSPIPCRSSSATAAPACWRRSSCWRSSAANRGSAAWWCPANFPDELLGI